jgi:NADP-dependent alcohol dehydrogenase
MNMKTVTLTSFRDNVQAHMLQDILKNEGIESMLQGELANQVMSPLYNLQVQVLVFEDDLERAQAILKEAFPEQ